MTKVAIIGGGAAGLMASYQAASRGAEVYLFERNPNLGRKILISGKGRCNLTNIKNLKDFIANYPGNGKFLFSSLTAFSNTDLIAFFEGLGVKTKVERGGRVFPQSDKSLDVVNAMQKALKDLDVNIMFNSRVRRLVIEQDQIKGILFGNTLKEFYCDKVVIATGGLSYPSTGSTGDGYELALQAGHTIVPLKPSLVPLICQEDWVKDLQGLTLKNVEATVYVKQKKIASEFGEMLFTHYGISGPIILTLSRQVVDYLESNPVVSINLKPALTEQELEQRLLRDFNLYKNKMFKNSLNDLLPKKMIPVFVNYTGIDPEKKINQITRNERKKILDSLRNFCVTITGCREKEAIVTRGGVSIKEINPKTMESKKIKGLYFAGEVIDIDGVTGGYNLQAAFSTGFVAGCNCA
ncbi:MAG TPA: NAD(P)/FAD-dependent oxidoreductase [Thermoanaerobacterales bacterium]|nr:NAD(P)/FAD-dependent oxidoreductase [Thermoanaerobacterales bacterium]